jgi:pimeloyl-ACP methyl ester carboxylesterase
VVLHGHGDDDRAALRLGLDRFLADAVRRGVPPFVLAAPSGGDGYWHARTSGDDAGAMVVEEFLPLLAARGLACGTRDRVALLGWSMGGYGALLLAERLGAARVAGAGAMSPALWRHAADAVSGAFDDAADFAAHDVFAGRDRLQQIPVRLDCGRGDPFLDADRAFAAGLRPAAQGDFGTGGHTDGYWRRMAPGQLATLGTALAAPPGNPH